MAEKLVIRPERCKSCGLCIAACPRKALYFGNDSNRAGYKYIMVDEEKCSKCGSCYTACPDYVFTIEEVSC